MALHKSMANTFLGHHVESSIFSLSFCFVAAIAIFHMFWQTSHRNSHILTYHTSNTLRTKEALATGLAVLNPQRYIFWVLDFYLIPFCNSATPSWFTPRNPRGQITILVGFQIVANRRAPLKKAVEVELDFRCSTYSAWNVSCICQNLIISGKRKQYILQTKLVKFERK